jgi:hypothetical protein
VTVAEHVEQRPDLQLGEEGMAQVRVPVDLVPVAAAFIDPHEKAFRNEVGDDLLRGPLPDSDARSGASGRKRRSLPKAMSPTAHPRRPQL